MSVDFGIESLIRAYRFSLLYAGELAKDLDMDLMYRSFGPGLENTRRSHWGTLSWYRL